MQGSGRDDVPDGYAALLPLDRRQRGEALVFLLRHQTAVRLGRRPTREDLAGDRLLLTAFRLSDPTEELRADAFLAAALARLEPYDDEVAAALEAWLQRVR